MKKLTISLLFLLSLHLLFGQKQDTIQLETKEEPQGINIGNFVTMSGHWFIAYRDGYSQTHTDEAHPGLDEHESALVLKRSYFTLKKDIDDIFSVRYTQDITIDTEGDDAGNVETRMKYLYLKVKPRIKSKMLTGTWLEVGMVHRPWLDYEQKINTYRVQDNMAIERNKLFNSADFGVTIGGNIGPKMDKSFLREVNGAMKGKYFSYSLGVYNGGGYSGAEKNTSKVFATRLSARPFPNKIPELQLSTYFNLGKGNTEHEPDFNQLMGFVAWTGRNLTLTAQYHTGEGDFKGKYVMPDDKGKSLKNHGYSFFGEYKFGTSPWAIWGRHDYFSLERELKDDVTRRYIAGLSYRINKNIRLILNTEQTEKAGEDDDVYELNLEIVF
ncbi:hypothetical protein C7377_0629 [Balneicella halophila]|uniref:Phosphate-selective porin O/P n=1 Tax=Balneicella halophila TaxID=1537566 RepID=A0A7L4URB8_BALHA|nr:hypothetical protein [Balneicella halophila]PVX52315.1 hypothetical protein C7377_0629 [Balneicella halophila]